MRKVRIYGIPIKWESGMVTIEKIKLVNGNRVKRGKIKVWVKSDMAADAIYDMFLSNNGWKDDESLCKFTIKGAEVIDFQHTLYTEGDGAT